jgi:hypothetical protein
MEKEKETREVILTEFARMAFGDKFPGKEFIIVEQKFGSDRYGNHAVHFLLSDGVFLFHAHGEAMYLPDEGHAVVWSA